MKHSLLIFLFLLSLAAFAAERPISKSAVNVTVDEEPFCRGRYNCITVNRIAGNPKLFTVQFMGRDSVITDKLTAFSTRSRRISAKNIEELMGSGSIVIHGWYSRYSAKGVLERHSYFQNGKRDSTNYIYYPVEGNYMMSHYSDGVKEGMEQEVRNGKLLSEVRYYDGKPEPTRVVFDGNSVRGVIRYDTLGLITEATEYYLGGSVVKRIEKYEPDTVAYAVDSVYREKLVSVEHFDASGSPVDLFDDYVVMRPPVYFAKEDSLNRYLLTHVEYPISARMIELEAIVQVSVEIDTDGSVVDATIIPPSNAEFSYEAMRVIKNMPRWQKAGLRYWRPSKERVVVHVPFFMKYSFDKPVAPEDYWKKPEDRGKTPPAP
jgi:hypothetical protein